MIGTVANGGVPAPSGGRPVVAGASTFAAWSWRTHVQIGVTAAAFVATGVGGAVDSGTIALVACAALLVLGLPHGSFDMLLIVEAGRGSQRRLIAVLLCYIGLAAAAAVVWSVTPGIALAAFVAIAIVHFSEDWRGSKSMFLALGTATALIAAPSVLHGAELETLLGMVATPRSGSLIAAALTMVAPAAIVISLVGFALLARTDRERAVGGLVALAALIVLPPLTGFALFFCLLHSPIHFTEAALAAGHARWRRWAPTIVFVSAAALGITATWLLCSGSGFEPGLPQASFRTLAILTLPHILLPFFPTLYPADKLRRTGQTSARRSL